MRRRPLVLRLIATVAVAMLLLGGAKLFAAIGGKPTHHRASATTFATGALTVSNSRDRSAIFTAANVGPGSEVEGTVTIGNSGSIWGSLALAASDLSDAPGTNGGALSEMLTLRIDDVTDGPAQQVWAGGLAQMPELQLPALAPGSSRTYRFAASLPDGGAPATEWSQDNLYQRASTAVSYDWTLTEAGAPTEPDLPLVPDRDCGTRLLGGPSSDRLTGTAHGDTILGHGGNDVIAGLGGDDCIWGGAGVDREYGDQGDDQLRGGPGRDWLRGGSGSDLFFARGRGRDSVKCGSGYDVALIDSGDMVRACEVVRTH